jgi:hypothetical protein
MNIKVSSDGLTIYSTPQIWYLCNMGRNNDRNIKKHNDKLHKAQDKAKKAVAARREKLSAIVKKYNDTNPNTQP